jgi:hypothetical protein
MTVIDLTQATPEVTTMPLTKRPRRDWFVRHIPVMVKGRSPRQYRVPKLISSVVMGVCLYLAVHLNQSPNYSNDVLLHRGERDLSSLDSSYSQYYYQPYPIQYYGMNESMVEPRALYSSAMDVPSDTVIEMEVQSGYLGPDNIQQ